MKSWIARIRPAGGKRVLRKSSKTTLGVFAAVAVGSMCWSGLATGVAAAQPAIRLSTTTTTITVTAGKPTELAFKLSKTSAIPTGTVVFKVTNRGALTHSFKLCSSPVTNDKANSCAGLVTRMLKPGQSATLTVTLKKAGRYEYLCTVPGHAGAGMKGLLGAVASASSVKTTAITVSAGKPSALAFELSKTSAIPAGTVVFKVTNRSALTHSFKLCSSPVSSDKADSCVGLVTRMLKPGQSATLTVSLKKAGKYEYLCTVPGHAAGGMKGLLSVIA